MLRSVTDSLLTTRGWFVQILLSIPSGFHSGVCHFFPGIVKNLIFAVDLVMRVRTLLLTVAASRFLAPPAEQRIHTSLYFGELPQGVTTLQLVSVEVLTSC